MPFARRQALIVAAALVTGGFLGWLLFAGHGDSSSPRARPGAPTPFRGVSYPSIGLSLAQPTAWKNSTQHGVVKLLSSDQSVSVAISAPAAGGQAAQLRKADAADLKRLFHPARLVGRQRGRLGGLPAVTTELIGTSPRHTKIRILSTAVSSAYRTYSVQIFTAVRPSPHTLLELRAVLSSVRFTAPKK